MKNFAAAVFAICLTLRASIALGEQPCFLVLTVKEKEVRGLSELVLYSASAVSGPFNDLYNPLNSDVFPYLIRARDAAGTVKSRASFPSHRLTFADGANGAVLEAAWAAQYVYLPYNRDILSIEIVFDGRKRTFPLDAASMVCRKTCADENQSVLLPPPQGGLMCCPWLVPVPTGGTSYTCRRRGQS